MRISDWSSDVCSSDLDVKAPEMHGLADGCVEHIQHHQRPRQQVQHRGQPQARPAHADSPARSLSLLLRWLRSDRQSVVSGKSVSVRVDLGGGRNYHKKKNSHSYTALHYLSRTI